MSHTLRIGNLPTRTSAADVRKLLSRSGTVQSVRIAGKNAPGTGSAAIVEMASAADARAAMAALRERRLGGRVLTVAQTPAREPTEHDLLGAIRRTPPLIGGELADGKRQARGKRRVPIGRRSARRRRVG